MWNSLISSGEEASKRLADTIQEHRRKNTQEDAEKEKTKDVDNCGSDDKIKADGGTIVGKTKLLSETNIDGGKAPLTNNGDTKHENSSGVGGVNLSRGFAGLRQSLNTAVSGGGDTDPPPLLNSLRVGWGSMSSSVVKATEKARKIAEEESEKIRVAMNDAIRSGGIGNTGARPYYARDPSLPFDTEALRDAEVVYITDRIVTLSHPSVQSPVHGDLTPERKLAAVSHLLDRRHPGRYMVWNLSEIEYACSAFHNQLLAFKFPGSPSPPLGMLLKILVGMESWLKADDSNVLVVHCLTGRGRTSSVVASFLCWIGEAGFHDIETALAYVAQCKRIPTEELTIPSQRRYCTYFSNMLDGVRPSQPPLLLKRIIMSSAPKFGKRPALDSTNKEEDGEEGCSPYIQLFKAGKLIFTAPASLADSENSSTDNDLPFIESSSGPVSFIIETVVQGDILVRCRHLSSRGQRVSVFRAALHTGYVPPKVLRLARDQLDGACRDSRRFGDGFFLDLVFGECDAETAGQHLQNDAKDAKTACKESDNDKDDATSNAKVKKRMSKTKKEAMKATSNEATGRRALGNLGEGGVTGQEAYDSMLHRDSRFWDVIIQRKERRLRRGAMMDNVSLSSDVGTNKVKGNDGTKVNKEGEENTSRGSTIGKKRVFAADGAVLPINDGERSQEKGVGQGVTDADKKGGISERDAFSIVGELDFLGDGEAGLQDKASTPKTVLPKKDDLMDALMALEDDIEEDNEEQENDNDSIEPDIENNTDGQIKYDNNSDDDISNDEEIIVFDENDEVLESSVNDDNESKQTHIETVTNIDTQDSSVIKVQEDKQSLGNDDGTIESSSSPSTTAEGDIDNIFAGGTTTQDDNMIDANKDLDIESDKKDDEDFDLDEADVEIDGKLDEELEDLENFLKKA